MSLGLGRHWSRALAVVGVYAVAWFYLYYLQFQTPHMPGTDGYFHITFARLTWQHGVFERFPWATFSTWADTFFDKDFGFHLLLLPFVGGDLIWGAKIAAVTYGAVIVASFFLVLSLSSVRHPWFWAVLLLACGGYFGWRINVPRPQLLSMTLSLWCMLAVLRRWRWALFGVSAVYALCYTAPYVGVGYAVFGALAGVLLGERLDWRLPLWGAAGVLLGWLIHPNFPNNFAATWLQVVGVLSNAWGIEGPNLFLGGELQPADTRSFLREHAPVALLGLASAVALVRLRGRVSRAMLTLLGVSAVYFVLTCFSKRFVEYWVPFSVWLGALVLTAWWDAVRDEPPAALANRGRRLAALVALLGVTLAFLVRSTLENRANHRGPRPSSYEQGARWLAQNTPENAQLFTCDWDDAAEMFFYNHHNRYMVFLDPNYMYRWNPELWHRWHAVANGREREPAKVIRATFGAKYGYCTNNFSALRAQLEGNPAVQIRHRSGGGYVFELLDR